MISITTVIRTVYYFLASVHSGMRRETQFFEVFANQTMLTQPQRAAHLVMFRSLPVEIWKIQLHLSTTEIQLVFSTVKIQLRRFQNSQILWTISSEHDIIYTQAPFLVWAFLMTLVIVISFAREHKLHQLTMHLNS